MLARGLEDHLKGHRIVGLMLPRASSYGIPWREIPPPSRVPFATVFQAGSVRMPVVGNDLDLEHRIDAVRVLRMLRAEGLLMAGGCDALPGGLTSGSFVIIEDHVNCTGENPLRGSNDERLGPRYPDMSAPYDARWGSRLKRGAASMGLDLRCAVYGRVERGSERGRAGADIATWRSAGIDVVGEGLVDEVIAAVHCGLPIAAVGYVEKVRVDGGTAPCSSVPVRSADYGRLVELLSRCILCRGGMDDG